ncbi:MAG: universal stress protein [Methanohalobium sp.]|uniref:universal stress protein n=1 Tax=Methanohalobium sp. TaxID=2837493 RepID=UPI00397A0B5C
MNIIFTGGTGKMDSHYKKILISTDGSEKSENAIYRGIEFAKLTGAKVYAMYVLDTGAYFDHPVFDKEEAKKYTTDRVEEIGDESGVKIESVIRMGHPADDIIDFAKKNEIDLIVMGSLGKSGIERFLLGSVSDNVLKHADTEVLIVP